MTQANNKQQWLDALQNWKKSEDSNCVLLLSNDPELKLLIYAFQFTKPKWNTDAPCPAVSDDELWDRAWSNCTVDAERLEMISGITLRKINTLLQRLVAARIIYPDGEVNKFAKTFIAAYAKRRLSEAMNQ